MKKNKKAFSLIVAIGIVLISTLLAYTILEYIIPFGRNIKGVENSTIAYYLSNSGIERGLYFFSNRPVLTDEKNKNYSFISSDYKLETTSSGTLIPPVGRGNSGYDNNWNTLFSGNPIQLSIGNGYFNGTTLNDLVIYFRVPAVQTGIRPGMDNSTDFINWQLTSNIDTLNSSGSLFNGSDIGINDTGASNILENLNGNLLNGTAQTFRNFYLTNCIGPAQKCILKFSVINDLVGTHSGFDYNIPFVEWKVSSGIISNIPLRYSIIDSEGKSYGFLRNLNIRVPQETVSEAFDFTVFQ